MNVVRLFSGALLAIFVTVQSSFASLEPSTVEAYKAMTLPGIGKAYQMTTMPWMA